MPGMIRRSPIGWRAGIARRDRVPRAGLRDRRGCSRRRVAACLLVLLGLGIGGLPPPVAAQGEAERGSAERSVDRMVQKLITDLKRKSKVVVRPFASAHTGLPDSVADRIETLILGALRAQIPRDMEVTLVTGDDVVEIFGSLEDSDFGGDQDKLLESVLRSARADAVVACEPFGVGAGPSHFDIRCRAAFARFVCPGGGDVDSCREVGVTDIINQGIGVARIPYRNDEYLDHVFSDLAWKLATAASLGGQDDFEVVREGDNSKRNADFETYVTSILHEKIERAGRERLGPRTIGNGAGRRLKLGWSASPFGESYFLTVILREEGGRTLIRRSARVPVSAFPENVRLSDPENMDEGGGTEAGKGTEDGESSALGGQAILVVETEPPGASVVVGGERVGETPLSRSDLRSGSWDLVLDHPWYETIRLEGQVLEDLRVLRIDRSLVRASGAATAIVEPPVAGAWVEHGAQRREVPVTVDGLPVGPVVLTLGAPGHHELRVEVEVPKDDVALVRRRLEPVRYGTLTVTAVPVEASVTVVGVGPYRAGMRLLHGTYRVRVSREGYRASEADVEVSGESSLRVVLERDAYAFTVVTEPSRAEVRLLDVAAGYRPGMALPPGTYRVRVSASGWEPRLETVEHGRFATRHVVRLERLPPDPGEEERSLGMRRSDRVLVQHGLASLGFDAGPVDGVFGPRTRDVIRSYQRTKGFAETGYLTREVFEGLAALGKEVVSKPKWKIGEKFRDCAGCPEMVVVPSGSFDMGSPPGEEGRYDDEGPVHRVTTSAPFAVGVYEVTRGEWSRFVARTGYTPGGSCRTYESGEWENRTGRGWRNPGFSQSEGHPVVCVNWEDARAYVDWLSAETGSEYRLLSESEWEYVARGGTTGPFHYGSTITPEQANYDGRDTYGGVGKGRYRKRTVPVGSFRSNSVGLHEVHGNVWEWVEDCWHDSYEGAPSDGSAWASGGDCGKRVLRGGSWLIGPSFLRSAYRLRLSPGFRLSYVGFRVSRTLE